MYTVSTFTKNEDLLYYHSKILKYISQEKDKIPAYQSYYIELAEECYASMNIYGVLPEDKHFILSLLEKHIKADLIKQKENRTLSYKEFKTNIQTIKLIQSHIEFILNQDMIYIVNMADIIKRYEDLIKTPTTNVFLGRKKECINQDLELIYHDFIEIVKQSFSESILQSIFQDNDKHKSKEKKNKSQIICENCNSEMSENENLCYSCGFSSNCMEHEIVEYEPASTYDDIGRINVNKQFTYEKKCHFRDTINQYQGKQNKHIPEIVYNRLIEYIKNENLFDSKATTQIEQYRKVKKHHIKEFLKATGFSKHYEDLQLIYSKITGKPCPSISKYERQLYEDFDALTNAFLSLSDIKRDNFLNSHYVLRQLLLKQNVKLPQDDLNYLKTPARLRSHDEIYKRCCDILNWNFTPMS
jgi:hypothetical protein